MNMSDPDVKLVKVDNWGIFFLQRLKHFFNRTDYCDLTLQFQDNAQLKVHRLVLSACTEYFELLERTCEMYEDCLVMPDDLQADVVVPIVNFMYTGQLEFRMDLLERLYLTSQIMNMTVLTKLLEAHRNQAVLTPMKPRSFNSIKRSYSKSKEIRATEKQVKPTPPVPSSSKRSFSNAFGSSTSPVEKKKIIVPKIETPSNCISLYQSPSPSMSKPMIRKTYLREPRPTRYELPEELDTDDVCDNSFASISYTSQPLMIHPESTKTLKSVSNVSRKLGNGSSTVDIIECQKSMKKESLFEDDPLGNIDDYQSSTVTNQLFDQIIDQPGPKVTIETKDRQPSNMDHAKIISEVLKKYPHLVKSHKNIKLKILNSPQTTQSVKAKGKKTSTPTPHHHSHQHHSNKEDFKQNPSSPGYTYETDVLDSKEAAKLIALGAENVKGPWICLICGTPGKALHFTSYFNFRHHLVDVHNEKPISNMCEYCGLKSLKRNYLLHHLLTKHNVEPPPSYHFPKCNSCSYVALTEGLLVKHKLSHSEGRSFRCNVCSIYFTSSAQFLAHIKKTGHRIGPDRKDNLQCVYCLRNFLREGNLYAHLKTYHRQVAKKDGIIADSDEEETNNIVKTEQNCENEYVETETQYQIEVIQSKRPGNNMHASISPIKQKILNCGLVSESTTTPKSKPKPMPVKKVPIIEPEEIHEEIVMIDNNPYIMKGNELIPKHKQDEYILSDMPEGDDILPSTSMVYSHESITDLEKMHQQNIMNKNTNMSQPIQIVVSNAEEYKALMNSNHSIIFDDGDSNKTLTVLTTPHTATLDSTTIDLNNTPSTDMMLIQDNYAMNVSEAVSTDNSNIVVVYSHPVDDQDKEYRLITSQDIGAQFVQSSAVITQNFETVTTTVPIMEAQMINPQEAESWQNNEQESSGNAIQDINNMAIIQQAEIVPVEAAPDDDDEEELPEVTLTSNAPQEVEMTENEAEENSSSQNLPISEESNENSEPVHEDELATLTSMDVDTPSEVTKDNSVTDEPVEVESDSGNSNVGDQESNAVPNIDAHPERATVEVVGNVEEIQELNQAHIITEMSQDSVEIGRSPEHQIDTENPENIENEPQTEELLNEFTETEVINEQDDASQELTENIPVVAVPEIRKEQIQSLTSEWSEDEYDTVEQEPTADTEKHDVDKPNDDNEKESELEESIENIQQEMDNQMNKSAEVNVNSEEDLETNKTVEPAEMVDAVQPTEKISSLLNDWDENDSQEGNESTNGTEDDSANGTEEETPIEASIVAEIATDSTDTQEMVEANPTDEEESTPQKDDQIQKLVSDWDEDEEENKNVKE